jgi:ABC-type transporter Mla subunit MlaD
LADSKDTIAALPAGLDETLAEIRSVVQELKGMVIEVQPDIQSAMASLDRSTANLANLTTQLDDWMTRNEANLERFVEEGLGEAPALINTASQTMRDLEKLLATLQEDPSQLIHRPQQETLEIEP